MILGIHLGEATNPGPTHYDFHVGAINPSGINGKAQTFAEVPTGIWSISETQATAPVFKRFQKEVRWLNPATRISHGAYAPPRPQSQEAGAWTGVAQLAHCTLKPLNVLWDGLEFTSGRAMIGSFHWHHLCVIGATIYGPPSGPTYGSTKKVTEAMLGTITREIIQNMTGPRFVAGDFNLDDNELATFSHWRSLGWCEIQRLGEERWGIPRRPTSKGKTVRDLVWISPELARWMTAIYYNDELCADHAAIAGVFQVPAAPLWTMRWRMPAPLPWKELHLTDWHSNNVEPRFDWKSHDDSTKAFADWSREVERDIMACQCDSISLKANVMGRGQILQPSKQPLAHVPPGRGRHGDIQPKSGFLCRAVHLWYRQLRRMQAYVQRASSLSTSPAIAVDQMYTWNAIKAAKGFSMNFQLWWALRPVKLPGAPSVFPDMPPKVELATRIFEDFQVNYRRFESFQAHQRRSLMQAKNDKYNQVLFAQMKAEDRLPLEFFQIKKEYQITSVGPDLSVTTNPPIADPGRATWTLQQDNVHLSLNGQNKLFVDTDNLLLPGQKIVSNEMILDPAQIDQKLHDLWAPIWQKHDNLPEGHWDRVLAFGLRYLAPLPTLSFDWTAQGVLSLAKNYKKKSARGPDAWAREDIANLSPGRAGEVASLYESIQTGMEWPTQLLTGMITAVKKTPEAICPEQYRPIVVLSFLYRMWATGVSRRVLPQLAKAAPSLVFGYVKGKQASDIWGLLQAGIECSMVTSENLLGYNSDLIRCFNTLPRFPLMKLLQHLGLTPGITGAWACALRLLRRHFRVGEHIGQGIFSSTGLPEGDPLSCLGMLGFNFCLAAYMEVYAPRVACPTYVDNLQLLAGTLGDLCHGVTTLKAFLMAWDIQLDPGKSFSWATTTPLRNALRALGFPVKLNAKDLGAQMSYSALSRTQVSQLRLQSVQHQWEVLRRSSASSWHKMSAVRMAIWPKVLHGCLNRMMAFTTLCTLRTKLMNALHWNRAGASPWVRIAWMQPTLLDPEYYQIWQVLHAMWRLFRAYPLVKQMWKVFVSTDHVAGQGPFHSLMRVMETLEWYLDFDLQLWVHGRALDFCSLSSMVLFLFSKQAWLQQTVRQVSHRKDFEGLDSIDADTSFHTVHYADLSQQELLRTLQDGTFYTNYSKSKFSEEHTGMCAACGVEDDLTHRALVCPRYHALRSTSPQVVASWRSSTAAFNHHAIVPSSSLGSLV